MTELCSPLIKKDLTEISVGASSVGLIAEHLHLELINKSGFQCLTPRCFGQAGVINRGMSNSCRGDRSVKPERARSYIRRNLRNTVRAA